MGQTNFSVNNKFWAKNEILDKEDFLATKSFVKRIKSKQILAKNLQFQKSFNEDEKTFGPKTSFD